KEIVRGQIESQFGAMTRQKVKRQLLDALDEHYSFDLPEKLVENEFEGVWRQVLADMERSGKTFEDENTTEEAAKADYRKIAERRVRLGLVLSEVGEKNGIEVTDEEVQRALYDRGRPVSGQEEHVFKFHRSNPHALASLRAPRCEEKVVDYILALAKVTEKAVTKEELMKEDAEEAAACPPDGRVGTILPDAVGCLSFETERHPLCMGVAFFDSRTGGAPGRPPCQGRRGIAEGAHGVSSVVRRGQGAPGIERRSRPALSRVRFKAG